MQRPSFDGGPHVRWLKLLLPAACLSATAVLFVLAPLSAGLFV